MSRTNVSVQSRKFYERYHFPGSRPLDHDGLIFFRHFTRAVERMGDPQGKGSIRVLDAGCGTGNTSVALARRFKHVTFLGIDQSNSSLLEGRRAALRESLTNLRFQRWNLLVPLPKTKLFDVVLCLGVLHHAAEMSRILMNLRRAMRNPGFLFLWIYGRHGRYRHTLNVRALRYLVKTSEKEALERASEFVHSSHHVISDILGKVSVSGSQREIFESPVWIADQFLNPHEELLDMEGLLALVEETGFVIEQNLGGPGEIEGWLNSPALLERYHRLPHCEQQIVLDLLAKPERYFVTLRAVS